MFKPYIIIVDETQSGYISRRSLTFWSDIKLFVDLTPIMWHRVYIYAHRYTNRSRFKKKNFKSPLDSMPYPEWSVYIRISYSPILPSRDTKSPYNCARSRRGEYKRTSLTRIPLDHLGYKRWFSRSTHTDTMDSSLYTDERREGWREGGGVVEESVIALDSGLDNRALQAKFDSQNRNIFLACDIQNNLRGSAWIAPFAFVVET